MLIAIALLNLRVSLNPMMASLQPPEASGISRPASHLRRSARCKIPFFLIQKVFEKNDKFLTLTTVFQAGHRTTWIWNVSGNRKTTNPLTLTTERPFTFRCLDSPTLEYYSNLKGKWPLNQKNQRILIPDLASTALTARWRCLPEKQLRAWWERLVKVILGPCSGTGAQNIRFRKDISCNIFKLISRGQFIFGNNMISSSKRAMTSA